MLLLEVVEHGSEGIFGVEFLDQKIDGAVDASSVGEELLAVDVVTLDVGEQRRPGRNGAEHTATQQPP